MRHQILGGNAFIKLKTIDNTFINHPNLYHQKNIDNKYFPLIYKFSGMLKTNQTAGFYLAET
jgi:hypothetical protein